MVSVCWSMADPAVMLASPVRVMVVLAAFTLAMPSVSPVQLTLPGPALVPVANWRTTAWLALRMVVSMKPASLVV